MAQTSSTSLIDAAFVESLEGLRIVARRVTRGGRFAEHRSAAMGSGLEFKDYRPYSPGDDLRTVDWNIYRRLGRVFLRMFEELEDLPLYIMPDVSDSMFFEDPPRARCALRSGLALAAISLNQHDRVGVFPFATDTEPLVRPQAGKARLMMLADRMSRLGPTGPTDLPRSLERLGHFNLRAGLLVVISDFFDPQGIEAIASALRSVRHRLLLVQITREQDRAPALEGDLRLVDCESAQEEQVSVTPHVIERYQRAYDRFNDRLAEVASQRQAGLIRIDADAPVVPQLATLFESGRYVV